MNILTDKISLHKHKFDLYFDYLIKTNLVHNLTAIVDYEDVLAKHFLDSITAEHLLPTNANMLDIGAGAGFPSVPIKIMRDDIKVTMLDSVAKKVNFLKELINILDLSDIKAIHTRVEDYKDKGLYDIVVSRAVAGLPTLVEYALPFLKVGGKFVAYKSNNIESELIKAKSAIQICGGTLDDILEVKIDRYTTRKLITIKKESPTPSGYPRRGNKPRLKPL